MPAALRLTVNTITPELKAAQARARNLRPALQLFGARMIRSVDENFRRQGRRDGRPKAWVPLSAVTIAMRPKGQRGGRARPLVLTGRLRASTVVSAGRKTLAVGSNVTYANDHHQDGAWGSFIIKREKKKVPAHRRNMWVRSGKAAATRRSKAKAKRSRQPKRASVRPRTTATRTKRGKARVARAKQRRTGGRILASLRRLSRAVRRTSGVAPSAGLVRRKVPVRAHFQNRVSRIDARPIYVFQPRDLQIWGRLYRNWVVRGTLRKVA